MYTLGRELVHFTTFVTQMPIPHPQRALDDLGRCGFDPCAVTMAPGRAGSEVRIEFRLQLHALAYNLDTFLRSIEPPEVIADWSLTSLQIKLAKIGARVVRHARAITLQFAEVASNFGKLLVDRSGNPLIQNQCRRRGNKSTRLAGAPSSPNHEPFAKIQQLEEIQ